MSAGLVEVLRSHGGFQSHPGGFRCQCGVVSYDDDIHLADVITREWLPGALADEGVVAAACGLAVTDYLALYTLPANYSAPISGQSHEDVARRCGPLIAVAALTAAAEALGGGAR